MGNAPDCPLCDQPLTPDAKHVVVGVEDENEVERRRCHHECVAKGLIDGTLVRTDDADLANIAPTPEEDALFDDAFLKDSVEKAVASVRYLQSSEFPGFDYADIQAAYVAGARSGREHQPSDELITRSADAYVKSVAPTAPASATPEKTR